MKKCYFLLGALFIFCAGCSFQQDIPSFPEGQEAWQENALPGRKYLVENGYGTIFDLRHEGNFEEANFLVQKNKNHCLKLLQTTTSGDDLRNCLMFWTLTFPEDPDLPLFFYREYQKDQQHIENSGDIKITKEWMWGDHSNNIIFKHIEFEELTDTPKRNDDKQIMEFGNILIDAKVGNQEVCEYGSCDNTTSSREKTTFYYLFSGNNQGMEGKDTINLGRKTGDVVQNIGIPSFINAFLIPRQKNVEFCSQGDNYMKYECGKAQKISYSLSDLLSLRFPIKVVYHKSVDELEGNSNIFSITSISSSKK